MKLEQIALWLTTQTIAFTIRNPLEALAATAIISNPTTRGLSIQIGKHMAKQAIVDISFYSRLIGTNVVAPAGKRAVTQIAATASSPVVAIPATAIVGAAVGAAVHSGTVTTINRESNTTGTVWGNWSAFGGFQLGTVV